MKIDFLKINRRNLVIGVLFIFYSVVIFMGGISVEKWTKRTNNSAASPSNQINGVVKNNLSFNIFDLIKNGYQNDEAGIKWTVLAEETTSAVELVSIKDKMPLHIHKGENHYTYVISGKGEYAQSGKTISLEPGRFIFTPSMTQHSVKNLGPEPLLLLVFSSPKPFNEEAIEWIK
jgi:quercetin dioxygenase-like cupin family protein